MVSTKQQHAQMLVMVSSQYELPFDVHQSDSGWINILTSHASFDSGALITCSIMCCMGGITTYAHFCDMKLNIFSLHESLLKSIIQLAVIGI